MAVAEPLDRRDQALDRLAELLLIVGPFALVLATYAGYQVAGAALGPVERMRARAEQITERDTAERLPVPATNDEIEALGNTLNALLGAPGRGPGSGAAAALGGEPRAPHAADGAAHRGAGGAPGRSRRG